MKANKNPFEATEHEIQLTIETYLAVRRHKVIRVNSGMIPIEQQGGRRLIRLAEKGTSDLIVCQYPTGTFWAIEVKRPGKVPTLHQQVFLDGISAIGGKTLVAHS